MEEDFHAWRALENPHETLVETADFDQEVAEFMKDESEFEEVPPATPAGPETAP